jgi:type I restriction enzyme R subunit
MTEFKQIIGRGTRINEDYDKWFFTIMDFRNVTDLFADPQFDGEPVMVKKIAGCNEITEEDLDAYNAEPIIDPETGEEVNFETTTIYSNHPTIINSGEIAGEKKPKVYVAGVDVSVLHERVQYLDENGKLITESLKEYTKRGLLKEFRSMDDFLTKWNAAKKKKTLINQLESHGVILENLKEEVTKDLDLFDLICHVAWDMPPLSRKERAHNVRKRNYFSKYGEKVRSILNYLLDKYADEGIENIEEISILKISPLDEFGTPAEIIGIFGGKEKYLQAIKELEHELYKVAA